jgi:hypothetical protein
MERIKSIEHLRMQKELLQLQQMIAELRMQKEIHDLKRTVGLKNTLVSSIPGFVKTGMKTRIGKQLMYVIAGKLATRLFRRKRK